MSQRESWIMFEIAERKPKTNVWNVLTKDGQSLLGKVAWFGRWRRYAFFPEEATVFEHQCLDDIRAFLVTETIDQRRKP